MPTKFFDILPLTLLATFLDCQSPKRIKDELIKPTGPTHAFSHFPRPPSLVLRFATRKKFLPFDVSLLS
eukprot:c40695_g1_i1 orf=2-205(-)